MKNKYYGLFLETKEDKNDSWLFAEVVPLNCYQSKEEAVKAKKNVKVSSPLQRVKIYCDVA